LITSSTGAPKDYAELYEHYFAMMVSIVAKAGINAADTEDVAMEILLKFMEKDALSWYDPQKLVDVGATPKLKGEQMRTAKFQGLLRRFTSLYVRQHLDKQMARERREPSHAKLDAPFSAEEDNALTWGEAHAARLNFTAMSHEDTYTTRSAISSALTTAANLAAQADEVARMELAHAERREAQRIARETDRTSRALEAAILLAEEGERVTGRSVAEAMGEPASVGTNSLRLAREHLKSLVSEDLKAVAS
jgi:hypothetical protein